MPTPLHNAQTNSCLQMFSLSLRQWGSNRSALINVPYRSVINVKYKSIIEVPLKSRSHTDINLNNQGPAFKKSVGKVLYRSVIKVPYTNQ